MQSIVGAFESVMEVAVESRRLLERGLDRGEWMEKRIMDRIEKMERTMESRMDRVERSIAAIEEWIGGVNAAAAAEGVLIAGGGEGEAGGGGGDTGMQTGHLDEAVAAGELQEIHPTVKLESSELQQQIVILQVAGGSPAQHQISEAQVEENAMESPLLPIITEAHSEQDALEESVQMSVGHDMEETWVHGDGSVLQEAVGASLLPDLDYSNSGCSVDMGETQFSGTIEAAHSEDLYRCGTCGATFHYILDLEAHALSHKRSQVESGTAETLIDNIIRRTMHNEDSDSNIHQGSSSSVSENSQEGILVEAVECDICHKYVSKAAISSHRKRHGGKQHSCPVCKKAFTQKTHLQRHLRGHYDERPFQCSSCPSSFKRADHLQNHMRLHTGEKRINECEVCKKRFPSKRQLGLHNLQQHTSLEEVPCIVIDS